MYMKYFGHTHIYIHIVMLIFGKYLLKFGEYILF